MVQMGLIPIRRVDYLQDSGVMSKLTRDVGS